MAGLKLYHGTDARILAMTDAERKDYIADCNLVIDYLFSFFEPLYHEEIKETIINGQKVYVHEYILKRYKDILTEKGDAYLYANLLEKISMIDLSEKGCGLYQYGDLYVTDLKFKAMEYSRSSYAGGETGLCAYRMIQGAEIIEFENMKPDDKVQKAIDRIKDFAKVGSECPAIVTIENCDIENLLREDGKPLNNLDLEILNSSIHGVSYIYTKPLDLNQCKVELLNSALYEKIIEDFDKGIDC